VVFQQVHVPVRQEHSDSDVGIGLKELTDHRHSVKPTKHNRRGDDEFALGNQVLSCGRSLGFSDLVENALAGRDIGKSVSVSRRVDRVRRRVPMCSSRSASFRLTVGNGTFRRWLAPVKLPASTTATRIDIASRRSIDCSKN
jgi:hypothetical protein